jgi:DNA-binding PadR family transcriptional regulator
VFQASWCRCGPFRVNLIPQGLLKPYILRLLTERPMHGFELMEEIFARTEGMWRPGPSAVYPTLVWLEAQGYIEAVTGERRGPKARRPFSLTRKGRDALRDEVTFRRAWMEGLSRLRQIWQAPPRELDNRHVGRTTVER